MLLDGVQCRGGDDEESSLNTHEESESEANKSKNSPDNVEAGEKKLEKGQDQQEDENGGVGGGESGKGNEGREEKGTPSAATVYGKELVTWQSCRLRRDAEEEVDYVLLPAEAWEQLHEWYGGGPIFERQVRVEVCPCQTKNICDSKRADRQCITLSLL